MRLLSVGARELLGAQAGGLPRDLPRKLAAAVDGGALGERVRPAPNGLGRHGLLTHAHPEAHLLHGGGFLAALKCQQPLPGVACGIEKSGVSAL